MFARREETFPSCWSLIQMLSIWIPGRLVERGNAEHLNRGDNPCLGARIVSFIQMLSVSMIVSFIQTLSFLMKDLL
jgi:hypothetical protein